MGKIFLKTKKLNEGLNAYTPDELVNECKKEVEKDHKIVKHITTVWGAGCVYHYFEVSETAGKLRTFSTADFED